MRRLKRYDSEDNLHAQVCTYLRLQYPDVPFRTDMGGIRLTVGQATAARRLQHGRAWPDLFIAQENAFNPNAGEEMPLYNGLFLELKKAGTKLYRKDGQMVANEHYREQAQVLENLRKRGYKAEFAVGFDEAKEIIDDYLKGGI